MSRWVEFFEGSERDRLSMARLLQLMAWPPATAVLIWVHTTEAMSCYLAAFVLNTGVSKGLDVWKTKKGGGNVVSKRT